MKFKLLPAVCALVLFLLVPLLATAEDETVGVSNRFLRAAYQYGSVMGTNDFVTGTNQRGEPIDTYYTVRLEFGWQTDGSQDWHHTYNFPSYGIGVHYGDYFNDEELGTPTSLYGFFGWPVARWGRNSLNVDMGFGLADNWVAFDEIKNPYNVAIGAGRSVYIDAGLTYELALSRRWDLRAGFTFTHYSNGGSQQPNWGINQIGPLLYVNYDLQEGRLPEVRRQLGPYTPHWQLATTFAMGVRNLERDLRGDPEFESYLTKDYAVANLNITASRQFTHKSRYGLGLDIEYDDSVSDLALIDATENGTEPESIDFFQKMGLGICGGYELVVNRADMIVQLGYTVLRKDVEGRLPRFYQRLGMRFDVYRDLYAGLNVRFHDFSRADNLEINLGYKWGL